MAKTLALVPGRLYAITTHVPLDARISWVAPASTGVDPVNLYVILGDDEALIIDTGLASDRSGIAREVDRLIGDRSASIVLTRMEFDCTGNISALVDRLAVNRLIGIVISSPNDFPLFPQLVTKMRLGDTIRFGQDDEVVLVPPPLRVLPTAWIYDAATSTLFTSDFFTHLLLDEAEHPLIAEEVNGDVDTVRKHYLAKYSWLQVAQTGPLIAALDALFEKFRVNRIAPGHGRIIEPEKEVHTQLKVVKRAIA